MLKQTLDGIYQSNLLLSQVGIVHGYSSRHLGDMRKPEIRERFLSLLPLDPECVVFAEQIHGNTIQIISLADRKKEVPQADGLVHKRNSNVVSLAVRIADCVPLLAVDPRASIIGVAHAGWKGTLGGIATHLIGTMKSVGAKVEQIFVSIGPHIGMCCYSVPEDRAAQFTRVFGGDPRVISRLEGLSHLDIGYVNMRQLLEVGIPVDHIDAAIDCTSCQVDTFYSFRKDTQETFGEILGVIGFGYEY